MKDKFEVNVKPSPTIKESLAFGFTDCRKAESLKLALKTLAIAGHPNVCICDLDMVFGYAIVTLPNPAIDLDVYISVRNAVVQSIKSMVEGSENGS